MKRCPKCSRSSPEEAKFCRACYTVFPIVSGAAAAARRERQAKTVSALVQLFIVSLGALAVWLIQVDVSFFRATKARVEESIEDVERGARSLVGGGDSPVASNPEVERAEEPLQHVAAADVERSGTRCIANQTVYNGESHSLSPVELEFSFKDAVGRVIGRRQGSVEAVLPPGARKTYPFSIPCPSSFASVDVHVPSGGRVRVGAGSAKSPWGEPQSVSRGSPAVRLEIPAAAAVPDAMLACPSERLCPVVVRFSQDTVGSYSLRWLSTSSATLVAADRRASELLQQFSEGILEVRLQDGRVRTLPILKGKGGQWISHSKPAADS